MTGPHRPLSIVHIGTHKTGTTAFQTYLTNNRDHFAAAGIDVYLDPDTGRAQAHHFPLVTVRRALTFPLRRRLPDSTLDEAVEDLTDSISRYMAERRDVDVLISHEALSFIRSVDEVRHLQRLVGDGRDVRILLVLREPTAFLESWRAQLAKRGHNYGSQYSTGIGYTEPDSWLVDYPRLIDCYRQVFGEENVIVLSHEEEMASHGSVVPALARECGLDPALLPAGWEEQRNVRPR